MAIPTTIPSPEFVEFDAGLRSGLDLMGLRLPVQAIGNNLLNGITTITPTVRYLSLRTWLLDRYRRADPPPSDRYRDFVRYARHAEAAFALANLVRDTRTGGLIGPQKGARKLEQEEEPWIVESLAKQPAVNAYARPSDQLRLTRARDPGIPAIGREHGLPLAEAMEASLGETAIGKRLRQGVPLDLVTRDELEEFGAVAWVGEIPDPERRQLIGAILPAQPTEDDLPRLRSYALLLSLAELDGPVDERGVFAEATLPDPRVPPVLTAALDGWAMYAVRDAIAVTGEATLEVIVRRLAIEDPDGAGVPDYRLVSRILDESEADQAQALRELGLISPEDDLAALPFRDLRDRIRQATNGDSLATGPRRIRRWRGSLTEPTLWNASRGARDGVVALGLVAWLVAERRAGDAVRAEVEAARALSHQGTTRYGLRQVILPRLAEWIERDLTVAAALGEFIHLAIDQHLRIVWTRLAQDPKKDVSVVLRDGDQIIRRRGYEGGRTASRINRATGWLEQLGLLSDGSLTDDGHLVLQRTLDTLGDL